MRTPCRISRLHTDRLLIPVHTGARRVRRSFVVLALAVGALLGGYGGWQTCRWQDDELIVAARRECQFAQELIEAIGEPLPEPEPTPPPKRVVSDSL